MVVILALSLLTACNPNEEVEDPACAYCRDYYNAGYGNYGSFSIAVMDGYELEEIFDDLSKFTLGGAFEGMTIEGVYLSDDYSVVFSLSGALNSGDFGEVKGEGIVKGQSVDVKVFIAEAYANTSSILYTNDTTHTVELSLNSACFNKELSVNDFVLSGVAEDLTITSVTTDYYEDEGGVELSQNAVLTLSGELSVASDAYVEILSSATTYNKNLSTAITTAYRGATVLNATVDTFALTDTVYVEASNLHFNSDISVADITLSGAFEDYAVVEELDYVSDTMIALHISFPYTYLTVDDSIGYIEFSEYSNVEGVEFTSSALLGVPKIDFAITVEDKSVKIQLELENGEFNLLSPYPFCVYKTDGTEVMVTDINIVNMDEYLSIEFTMPYEYDEALLFEIEGAYDIVDENGMQNSVTVKTYFTM